MIASVVAEAERSVALLERLVNENSGTLNLPGVTRVGEMMRAELAPLGFAVELVGLANRSPRSIFSHVVPDCLGVHGCGLAP